MDNVKYIKRENRVPSFNRDDFYYIFIMGILTSFIGFIIENATVTVLTGEIDSRYHILPFLGIYILIPFALHIILVNPDDVCIFKWRIFKEKNSKTVILSNMISFFIITLSVFSGEIAVGSIFENFFGIKLWDYSGFPMNITDYTCSVSIFGFGIGAYLLFKFVYFPFLNFLKKHLNYKIAKFVSLTLGTLIILDSIRLLVTVALYKEAPMFWSFKILKN